jgi:hypothetical protein
MEGESLTNLPEELLFGLLQDMDWVEWESLCRINRRVNILCQDSFIRNRLRLLQYVIRLYSPLQDLFHSNIEYRRLIGRQLEDLIDILDDLRITTSQNRSLQPSDIDLSGSLWPVAYTELWRLLLGMKLEDFIEFFFSESELRELPNLFDEETGDFNPSAIQELMMQVYLDRQGLQKSGEAWKELEEDILRQYINHFL